jgi:rhamnogalacturonyl hydrolase YesR
VSPTALGQQPELRAEFLRLCDAGCRDVRQQARTTERTGRAFYWDSYVVRGLAVAYDMTGKEEYIEACKLWSDRMIEYQKGMIPKGAYYMQYGRRPGQRQGNWYVADCSSIALGVLATAIRCEDPTEKQRYLDSVKSFARLVADNFVRTSGGVTDGYWPKSDKEWWCSSGIFGSLMFCLFRETGEESYLKIGLGTIDWLNRQDLLTVAVHYPPETIKPTVMMYCLEAYSAGLPYLTAGTPRHEAAMAQLARAHSWMSKNLGGRAGIDYVSQWGSKSGGLPFHVYVYTGHVPDSRQLAAAADRELRYIAGVLGKAAASNQRDQLALFAMMSYAEKLSPGSIYRKSKR